MHDKQSSKCDIRVESKIMKKIFHFVKRQIELLGEFNSYRSCLFKTNNV